MLLYSKILPNCIYPRIGLRVGLSPASSPVHKFGSWLCLRSRFPFPEVAGSGSGLCANAVCRAGGMQGSPFLLQGQRLPRLHMGPGNPSCDGLHMLKKKKKNLRENGLGKLKTTEGASSGTPLHALIPLPICLKAFPLFPLAFLLYLTFAVFTTCLTFLPNFLYFPPSCFSLSATHSSQLWEFFAMFYHHLERCNFSGGRYLPFVPITLIQFCDLLPKSNKLQQNVPISTPEL